MLLQTSDIMNNLQMILHVLRFRSCVIHPHFEYLAIMQATQLLFHHGTIFIYTKSSNRTSEKDYLKTYVWEWSI